MSATNDLIAALVGAGMDIIEAAGLVARAGAEMASGPSKGALRTRKWRAGQASQTVTSDADSEPNVNVTERHKPSPSVTCDNVSLYKKESKKEESKKERVVTRASQLPEGWLPDEHIWRATVDLVGLDCCNSEFTKFKNHAADKGRVSKSWNSAWRNWVDRSIEYRGQNGNGKPKSAIIQAADNLCRKIAEFDGPPRDRDEIRSGEGQNPPRLLSYR